MTRSLNGYPQLSPVPSARRGSLGFRILLGLAVVWVLLLLGLNAVLRGFIGPAFVTLERQQVTDDIARVLGALKQDLDALSNSSKDYATWDDMHGFAQTRDPKFVESNLQDSVFSTLQIDLLLVYNVAGESVYAKALGAQAQAPAPIAEANPNYFKSQFPVLAPARDKGPFDHLKHAGFFRLKDSRLMATVAVPITKSDGQGPVAGTVVMGRLLSDGLLEELQRRTKLTFKLNSADRVTPEPSDDQPVVADGRVLATTTLFDPFRRPIAKLRISRPASIAERGQQTLTVASLSTLAVLTVALIALLVLLNFFVILPVTRLAQTINTIHTTGNLDNRVSISSNDEIGFLAQSFDRLIALLGQRAQTLEYLATSDELTALFNRRFIMESLNHEVDRAFRYGQGLAILILDVDFFKRINDTAGHPAGDRVLRTLAQILKRTLRDTDRIGRYGGEEFLVLMPHQTPEGALIAAERVRSAVEASTDHGLSWKVTVSIGVAVWNDHTRDALLYIADQNLYRAKQAGRNRVNADMIPNEKLPAHSIAAISRRSLRRISSPA